MSVQRCINTLISYLPGEHAVISPGSRNASIIYALENSAKTCHSVIDERSAAFVALGIAKQSKQPVILCCTNSLLVLRRANCDTEDGDSENSVVSEPVRAIKAGAMKIKSTVTVIDKHTTNWINKESIEKIHSWRKKVTNNS